MSELEKKLRPTIIVKLPKELTPEDDPLPSTQFTCPFDHEPTMTNRQKITYTINFQGIEYIFPCVWANVCDMCHEVFFDQELGARLMDEIRIIGPDINAPKHIAEDIPPNEDNNQKLLPSF